MSDQHFHAKPDQYGVFFIPADITQPMEYRLIGTDFRAMQALVGGYVEHIHTQLMPALPCGCQVTMVANEEGYLRKLPVNDRVQCYYPGDRKTFGFSSFVGDVFLIAEGPIDDGDEIDIDFVSLDPGFHTWEGPGHLFPEPYKIGD